MALDPNLTRPIVGIENRTAQEVFDIMCDRFTAYLQHAGEAELVGWRWKYPTDGSLPGDREWKYMAIEPTWVRARGGVVEPLFAAPHPHQAPEGWVARIIDQLMVREARRVEILNWLEEAIGTGWTCDNCGYSNYHAHANECADCGGPIPMEHMLAFKLHATATEDEELIAEARDMFGAAGVIPASPSNQASASADQGGE